MSKLIFANLMRLKKDKIFLCCSAAILIISVYCAVDNCLLVTRNIDTVRTLDDLIFSILPALGLFSAIFASLFLGMEYSDGTIRNKIIIGHTRTDIYIANLVACGIVSLVFDILCVLGCVIAIPVLGGLHISLGVFLVYVVAMIFSTAAVFAVMTAVAMNCSNRAISAVITLLLYLILLLWASSIYNALCEPPELSSAVMVTEAGVSLSEPQPNPFYIGGTKRVIYELILDFLPTGQHIQLANMELAHPVRDMILSILIIALSSLGGMLVFRKKNIK